MQKNSKINHRYYLRFFGKFWVILVGNIKNRIFKLPIICTLYSLALIPVSCYANNLYCYINW